MANISEIIKDKSLVENTIDKERAEDQKLRESFLNELPDFIGEVTKNLIDEMTDEEFRNCYTRSGEDWIQYEIRCKMRAGKMEKGNNFCTEDEVRHSFSDYQPKNAIERWMIAMLKHDAEHIAQLHHPVRSGGGAGQYLREGLFCTDNLGDINRSFTMAIQKVAKTKNHVRLLVGTDWGSCQATLTLTFPKNKGGN